MVCGACINTSRLLRSSQKERKKSFLKKVRLTRGHDTKEAEQQLRMGCVNMPKNVQCDRNELCVKWEMAHDLQAHGMCTDCRRTDQFQ